jgi:hypothetical protein
MSLFRASLLVGALLTSGISLAAATSNEPASPDKAVYRCGASYQERPCEQGQALSPSAGPTEAQRRQAEDLARTEQKRADALRAERLQRESGAARRLAAQRKTEERQAAQKKGSAKSQPDSDCPQRSTAAKSEHRKSKHAKACELPSYRGSTTAKADPKLK